MQTRLREQQERLDAAEVAANESKASALKYKADSNVIAEQFKEEIARLMAQLEEASEDRATQEEELNRLQRQCQEQTNALQARQVAFQAAQTQIAASETKRRQQVEKLEARAKRLEVCIRSHCIETGPWHAATHGSVSPWPFLSGHVPLV